MNAAIQASLFDDVETDIDIASRICRDLFQTNRLNAATHLRVTRAGPGWAVHGYNPATAAALLPHVAAQSDQSGTWFHRHPRSLGQTNPPTRVTAPVFTVLVRDSVD